VVATKQELINKVFWKGSDLQEYGIYVCKFYKDHLWR
jgi:hypothetical protein